ncbi:PHP-associated domain-containing protein [uncultured Methanoregula sp.]|uniref:PHP-associated domain-containing protein n=1 Tax=uncultured Methanoregula sp. TaxID=1005933 RepID=UPI00374A3F20
MIVESFQKTGILPLVCDHNLTTGSEVVYHELTSGDPDIPQILAEEIMTREGEIIGLFLTGMIPPYLSAAETLDLIHDNNGLAIVPHPFCSFRRSSALKEETLLELAGRIDIIEGFNSRNTHDDEDRRAREFALCHNKPVSVGSDAHHQKDLGKYWLELEPFGTPEELMRSLGSVTVRFPVMVRGR